MPAIIAAEKEDQPPVTMVSQGAPSELVIMFDWDDTLLSSTYLQSHSLSLNSRLYDLSRPLVESDSIQVRLEHEIATELKELESAVVSVLRQATQTTAKVVIVTNAEQGWVQLSAAKFLPAVAPLIDSIQVISARSTFQHLFPDSAIKWKYFAMHSILVQSGFFGRDGRPHVDKHVVSFGDSHIEREATRAVCRSVPSLRTKTVKFAERPTAEQLRRQLELVQQCFQYITTHPSDLDLQLSINLTPTTPTNHPSNATPSNSSPSTTTPADSMEDVKDEGTTSTREDAASFNKKQLMQTSNSSTEIPV